MAAEHLQRDMTHDALGRYLQSEPSLKELASVLIPGVDSNSLINLHAGCEEPNSAILAMAFFRSSTDDTTAPRIALAIER